MDPITSPAYLISPGLPVNIDVTVYRGDSWVQRFKLKQGSPPEPVDLTSFAVDSAISLESIAMSFDLKADILDQSDSSSDTFGCFVLSLQENYTPPATDTDPSPTPEYPPPGNYAWDVQITDDSSAPVITTWISGRFFLEKDVTA